MTNPTLRDSAQLPNLTPVIQWLESGCDPKEAAKELRIHQAAIEQGREALRAQAASLEPVALIQGSGGALREAVTGAVARGWCHKVNKHKEMDSDLALAISAEVMAAMPYPPTHIPADSEAVQLASSRVGRVYVAGPMTGIEDFNFPAFNAAAESLRAEGLTVLNPADHGVVEGADWGDYMRHDIRQLVTCDTIVLLPGWGKSKGANLEVQIAVALGLRIGLLEGAEAPQPQAVAASSPATAVDAVDDAMVDAYLKANDAYWQRTDELPKAPNKWRTGTPREATRESLRAALQASRQPQAQQAAAEGAGDVREALRMGIECLRNWKVLHPENFDATDERAVALLKAALAKEQRS